MTISRKVWAGAAAGILGAALGGAPGLARAGIINTETGEDWHPGFDENGNPDPPPDWVNSQLHASTTAVLPSTTGTVLSTEDICERPISDWIPSSTPALDLEDALTDGNLRQSFIAALEPWATQAIANELAGLGWWILDWWFTPVTPGPASVNRFICPTRYNLSDCLREGHDMWYCKTHASLNTTSLTSDLELEMPMTINLIGFIGPQVSGTVTTQWSLSYRVSDDPERVENVEEVCILVKGSQVEGFGLWGSTMRSWLDPSFLRAGKVTCGVLPPPALE